MEINITPSIKYIGVDDVDIDLFESQYMVPRGISYNSYIILDDKIAVMDTVDRRKGNEWMENLDAALGGKEPDYLIVQHMESDHAACIGTFVQKYPNTVIVATTKALQMMPQFEEIDFQGCTKAVKEGDTLCIGKHTLHFVQAPMVHWPEVMVTYESAEKILFSADAFGTFGALCYNESWNMEARRYFINIVGKYGAQVQMLLRKARALDIAVICPLHGPVLKNNLGFYIDLYNIWSSYKPETDGILVAHASIHGHTATAALAIVDILRKRTRKGVVVIDLCRDDMSVAVEKAFQFSRLVLAASSYDGGVFTPMHDFLHRLQIKNFQNRRIGIIENGSWAPSAGRVIKSMLEGMKNICLANPMVTIKSAMKAVDVAQMELLADDLLKEEVVVL